MTAKAGSMISAEPSIVEQALKALESIGALAELKDSMAVSISVSHSDQVLQSVLEVMGRFELEWDLSLSNLENPLSPETTTLLASLRNLYGLSLDKIEIQSADLARLGATSSIRRLTLCPLSALGSATEGIAALTSLEYLNVTGSGIDDEGLIKLQKLVRLREFVYWYANVDHGLAFLAGLPEIESIDVFMTQCGPGVLERLATAPCLLELNLSGCPIGASAVRILANFPALQALSLLYVDLSDADISLLLRHPHLRKLDLDDCHLTDAAFAHLPDHSKVNRLSLLTNQLSDTSCQRLRQFLPECEIRIDNTIQLRNPLLAAAMESVDQDGVSYEFDEQGFLHVEVESEADEFCHRFGSYWGLKSLVLYGASDRGLHSLREAPTLVELSLRPISDEIPCAIHSDGLAALRTMPRLRCLSLEVPEPLGDSLQYLSALPSLEELNLGPGGDLGRYAASLAEIPKLRRLSLRGCLWRSHCAGLAAFKTLEQLQMHSTEFKFEQLKGLAPPPALREVSLYCLPFTDEGWTALCAWKELTTISLSGMTESRLPLWKILALPQVEDVTIDNCQLELQSEHQLPIGSSLEKLSLTVTELGQSDQEKFLQRMSQVLCSVTISCEIKVTKIIHQLGNQRKTELIEMVGGLDPNRPGNDYESANPPISPGEAARRSVIRTFGGKLYIEAE
jgi:Leucine-rich repeat (LRR) protein